VIAALILVSALCFGGRLVLRMIFYLVRPLIKDAGDEQSDDSQREPDKNKRQHKTNNHRQHDTRAAIFFTNSTSSKNNKSERPSLSSVRELANDAAQVRLTNKPECLSGSVPSSLALFLFRPTLVLARHTKRKYLNATARFAALF
jgi:hypothetical protein